MPTKAKTKAKKTASRTLPTLRELVDAGAHYGHQRAKSYPKAREFTYTVRDHTFVIDLEKTQAALGHAAQALEELAAQGKQILFVGTKPQAVLAVRAAAEKAGMPFISERWLGGTLTNFPTIHKNLQTLESLEMLVSSDTFEAFTKRERGRIQKKLAKLHRTFSGIKELNRRPDALVLTDMIEEEIALAEARRLQIPVVAIVDTNANPDLVTYPIPANDDSRKTIALILNVLAEAVALGAARAPKVVVEAAADAPTEPSTLTVTEPAAPKGKTKAERLAAATGDSVDDAPPAQKVATKKTTVKKTATKKTAAKKSTTKTKTRKSSRTPA